MTTLPVSVARARAQDEPLQAVAEPLEFCITQLVLCRDTLWEELLKSDNERVDKVISAAGARLSDAIIQAEVTQKHLVALGYHPAPAPDAERGGEG